MFTEKMPAVGPILVLLCITAVLSHSAAAWAITVYPPSVFAHGRAIHVIPVWTGLTREALPDPNNPTSATIMQFAFAVEDLGGVNAYSGGIPDAACGPDGIWASFYPEVGNACYPGYQPQVGLPTDGCYCIYNTGSCPGRCDDLLDYTRTMPDNCEYNAWAPKLIFTTMPPREFGASSPVLPNTQYRIRVLFYNLDPSVAGSTCVVSPYSDVITTGWEPPSARLTPPETGWPTEAVLHGQIVSRYADTQWYFEYGTANTYQYQTPVQVLPAATGDNVIDVSATVTQLQAGTDYRYRLVTQNMGGEVVTPDQILTTEFTSPSVTGATCVVQGRSATFSAAVDPRGMFTGYSIQYGLDTSYGYVIGGGAVAALAPPTSVTVTGDVTYLQPGVLYHWRFAVSSEGGAAYSPDGTVMLPTSNAPDILAEDADRIAASSARITGKIAPNGLVTNWIVEYGESTDYGHSQYGGAIPASSGARSVSTYVRKLPSGSDIHYRLRASNSDGESVGADKVFHTLGAGGGYLFFKSFKCAWTTVTNPNLIGGAGKRGLARNSSASLSFTGEGIRLYSMTDPTLGQMKVWVDHRKAVSVNLKGATAYAVPVFEVTALGSGRHTLNVRAAGKGHVFVNAAEVIE